MELKAGVEGVAGLRPDPALVLAAAEPEGDHHVGAGRPRCERALFRRDGEFWTIGYRESSTCIRDFLGLRYIAELLRHPGREILALDLVAAARGQPCAVASYTDLEPGAVRIRADVSGEQRDLLDPRSRSLYAECLRELRQSVDEAEHFNDVVRATKIRAKKELLARERARRLRPGTPGSSSMERARVCVRRSISTAMRKISALHARLEEPLAATIRTGKFCVYRPDPRAPIRWEP